VNRGYITDAQVHNTDPNKNVNPNQVDTTKDNKNISHATGPSKVPEGIQKGEFVLFMEDRTADNCSCPTRS